MLNRIICIGDSITKGKVWRENERRPCITDNSYPQILGSLIKMDVMNEGICDLTSEQMLEHLNRDIRIEEGSTVIIEVGGNDCNPKWREIKKDPYGFHDACVPINRFKENLTKIIAMVKDAGAKPILSTLPPLDAEKYYNLLKRVFGEGIKIWIDKNGGIYKWQERFSDMVKVIADMTGTYLIDVRKSFLDTGEYKKYISFDGVHPNEDGYSLIADTCSKDLKLLLS